MKQNASFFWMVVPLVSFLAFGIALFVERMGLSYQVAASSQDFLEPLEQTQSEMPAGGAQAREAAQCLLLYDSGSEEGEKHHQMVADTLDIMRLNYDAVDVRAAGNIQFKDYQTIVIAFTDLTKVDSQILEFFDWVDNGGRALFSIRPDPSLTFQGVYRKLGIQSMTGRLVPTRGVIFHSDLMPFLEGEPIGEDFLQHTSLPVRLEDGARLHAASSDNYALPLLWEYGYGKGRLVIINSDQFDEKSSRGVLVGAYSILQDVFIYPVINSSVFFLDDFPGPILRNTNDAITKQFGRDIRSFFVNIWWSDMKSLAERYDIKYTGLLIETFDDATSPPFRNEGDIETFQYLGASLLDSGGELGVKGYNQIPICLDGVFENGGWLTSDDMRGALREVFQFTRRLFPEQPVTTFAPPDGAVCPEVYRWLPEIAPALRVVSSEYLPVGQEPVYLQKFEELESNLISFPRVSSGYILNEYQKWVSLNALALFYVNSHVIHPNAVLSDWVAGQGGWVFLRDQLDEHLMRLYLTAPGLRSMTASEGAMAVQRFSRISVTYTTRDNSAFITLNNFYDEAWMMMRTQRKPAEIEGGVITVVAPSLYLIEAKNPQIEIKFEE